jgi:hypothetical protein
MVPISFSSNRRKKHASFIKKILSSVGIGGGTVEEYGLERTEEDSGWGGDEGRRSRNRSPSSAGLAGDERRRSRSPFSAG